MNKYLLFHLAYKKNSFRIDALGFIRFICEE